LLFFHGRNKAGMMPLVSHVLNFSKVAFLFRQRVLRHDKKKHHKMMKPASSGERKDDDDDDDDDDYYIGGYYYYFRLSAPRAWIPTVCRAEMMYSTDNQKGEWGARLRAIQSSDGSTRVPPPPGGFFLAQRRP
jgi:hypothetical protein